LYKVDPNIKDYTKIKSGLNNTRKSKAYDSTISTDLQNLKKPKSNTSYTKEERRYSPITNRDYKEAIKAKNQRLYEAALA
jgi:hypothetical protein